MREDKATHSRPLPGAEVAPAAGPPPDRESVGSRRRAFSGGLWSAASAVLPMGGTLVLSVVISRELGADVLGQQTLISYVGSTLVSVLIYSITVATVQLLASAIGAEDLPRFAWLARWAFRAHVSGGVIAAGIMVGIGLARAEYEAVWFLAAATALVDALGWAHASRDIARRGWGPTASRRLVAQAISPIAAIITVYLGWGVQGVFTAQLVVAMGLLLVLRRIDHRGPTWSREGHPAPPWGPVLRLWGLLTLSILISQVVDRRLELVFLDQFHDARTVAMYSVAFSLVAIATTLSGALIGSSVPAIAARYAQQPSLVMSTLSRTARVVVTVDLVFAAGIVSVGPQLITAVYGPEFTEASGLIRWMGSVLLVVPLSQLYSALWTGIGRLRPLLVCGATGAVIDIVLAWWLIPPFATVGAVAANVGAQAVSASMVVCYTRRQGVRLELRPRRLASTTAIAVLAGAAAAASGLWDGVAGLLASAAAFCVVLALGARLVGLFEREDADWLVGTVPGPAAWLLRRLSPSR